ITIAADRHAERRLEEQRCTAAEVREHLAQQLGVLLRVWCGRDFRIVKHAAASSDAGSRDDRFSTDLIWGVSPTDQHRLRTLGVGLRFGTHDEASTARGGRVEPKGGRCSRLFTLEGRDELRV